LVVTEWQRSGKSIAAFARGLGIDDQRVRYWVARLTTPVAPRAPQMRFHPVRLVTQSGDAGLAVADARLEVRLADGRAVRVPPGFAEEDLTRVLHVLHVLESRR
jgi:transposase-like protein